MPQLQRASRKALRATLTAAIALLWGGAYASSAVAQSVCPATHQAFQAVRDRVLHPHPNHIVVVAHRACFSGSAENTPEAIEACRRMGVEIVENDVRRTKDGHLIIFHDEEVSRMTDRWGYVADMTLAELRQARLKERDGMPSAATAGSAFLTNIPITTLEEYLAAVKNKVMVNFEIKTSDPTLWLSIFNQSVTIARSVGVMDQLLFKIPDIKNHGTVFTAPGAPNARSPQSSHILAAVTLAPDMQLMPIIWQSDRSIASRVTELERFSPIGYEIPFQTIDYFEQVKPEHRLDQKPVMAVGVQPFWSGGLDDRLAMRDPDAAWGRLIGMGADYIMTDRPEALLRYLEANNLRSRSACGG